VRAPSGNGANGTWEARLTYSDPNTGRVQRRSFYGPTAKAVRDKMKAAQQRVVAGSPVKNATRTVGDWLAHWRATTLAASDRMESTREL
jgi:integrase